ncbi:MAG: cell division protein SepF [Coprococcus sp.]
MSKGFNKILDFMKLNDNEYDDYDEYDDEIDEDVDEIEEEPPKKKKTASKFKKSSASLDDDLNDFDDLDDETPVRKKSQSSYTSRKASSYGRSSKIVPMRSSVSSRGMEVCVSKPIDFNTCQEISDIILSGRAAIINFDAVTTQEAQRIIDFVSGACYAINGSAKQISDSIVIVTPEDIDITGDLQEMASSGVDVPAFGYTEEDD